MSLILIIYAVGVVINWVFLAGASTKEPEGTMGMGFAIPFTLIPFLFPILFCVIKCNDFFRKG